MEFDALVTWNSKKEPFEINGKKYRMYFFKSLKGDLKGRFFSESDLDLQDKVILKLKNYQPKGDSSNHLSITYVSRG